MTGMDAATGKPLSGLDHLIQSIVDVLSTPIGSRVMRRDYGSLLPFLVDQPATRGSRLALFAATADALRKWVRNFIMGSVSLTPAGAPGAFLVELEGKRTDVPPANSAVRLTFPLRLKLGAA